MTVTGYTDASHCDINDISACGYVLMSEDRMFKHEMYIVTGLEKSTNAEIFSIVQCLQYSFLINGVKRIAVYSDCKSIVNCVNRKRRRKELVELIETIDIIREYGISVGLYFVKSHASDWYNNFIDKSCIHNLRTFLKNTNNEKSFFRSINRHDPVRL